MTNNSDEDHNILNEIALAAAIAVRDAFIVADREFKRLNQINDDDIVKARKNESGQ
jgi:hypothetical protein